MSDELEQFKKEIDVQKDQLLVLLAKIGIEADYDFEIPESVEETPLGDLFAATKIAADQLKLAMGNLNQKIRQLEEKEQIIRAQSNAILELSTPVIQIQEGILVLPLVGTVDTVRAQQLLAQLLQSISEKKAMAVIIDITGVPMVDTSVASHLIKTVNAARMLGAECLLTGVSPNLAQSLVKAGIPLSDVRTRGTLQTGLEHALKITGREITSRAPKDS